MYISTPNWGERRFKNWLENHFPRKTLLKSIVAHNAQLKLDFPKIKGKLVRKNFTIHSWGKTGDFQLFI